MNDLNDKMKERWHTRRRKSYNWTKLILMVLVLVAILWGMGQLNKVNDKLNWSTTPETVAPITADSSEVNP